ncbi:MAG: TRZ/ATZ family protein [Actinobacteria bacterium]|nr:MAG: TRZ/ATZ family protein [Actinomycetota bacterium]
MRAVGEPRRVSLPWSIDPCDFSAGDKLLLSGPVYAARDKTHRRLIRDVRDGSSPVELKGATIFYAGPTPAPAGRAVGAVGPTTSKRMDAYTPFLLSQGVSAFIGKGTRSEQVRKALTEARALYLVAIGGTAAFLSTRIESQRVVAYEELGAEALWRMELRDFPVYVAIDCDGNDLLREAPAEWGKGRE